MNIDERIYLEHHGVKGMHWGIRQGKEKTGVSRTVGATIDRNNRMKKATQRSLAGKSRNMASLAENFKSEPERRKALQTRISNLDAQNARLKSGNRKTRDILSLIGTVNYDTLSLWIAKKPNK